MENSLFNQCERALHFCIEIEAEVGKLLIKILET